MKTELKIGTLENDLKRLAELTGRDLNFLMRNHVKGIIKTVDKATLPKNNKAGGEQAVARDVNRSTAGVHPTIINAVQSKGGQPYYFTRKRDKKLIKVEFKTVDDSSSSILSNHKRQRNPRTGKVNLHRAPNPDGMWKEDVRIVSSHANKNKARAVLQKFVGWSRSGWGAACTKLSIKQPGWVTRNGSGGEIKTPSPNDPNQTYTIQNDRISYKNFQPFVNRVVESRAKILQNNIRKIIKGVKINLGF